MDVTMEMMLIRKQYLVSTDNVNKLAALSKSEGISAAEVVRKAIDAYDPDGLNDLGENELITLVSERLKEAIKETKTTRRRLSKTLKSLGCN